MAPSLWDRGLFHYQPGVEGVEEELPSDGAVDGVSAAGVVTGAGSGAGAGAGAGFGLTTRFLAAFLAFFFIAFLAFRFFFAKTRFTEIMFRLWKPNNAFSNWRVSLPAAAEIGKRYDATCQDCEEDGQDEQIGLGR